MDIKVDYSLYLVTDSTKEILGDKNLLTVVEEAIKGGLLLTLVHCIHAVR